MAPFFQLANSWGLTLTSAPGAQLAEIAAGLNEHLVATDSIPQASAKEGWKLFAVGSAQVSCKNDFDVLRPGHERRVWLKWGDRDSVMVNCTQDAREAASRWQTALAGSNKVRCLLPKFHLQVSCAADACATRDTVGYGSWLTFRHADTFEPVRAMEYLWFQEVVDKSDFSADFGLGDSIQSHIACFETFAQMGLVYASQFGAGFRQFDVVVPALDDNQPSEAAINRLFTTSKH